MRNHLAHTVKIITKARSSALCKAALAIVLSSLALPCFSQTVKMERLFQIPGSMFPEVMLRWTLQGGCFYYKTIRADFIDDLEKYKQTYEWSDECIAGKPLNGSGELLGLSVNFRDEYIPDQTPTVGNMVNGRWDGVVRKGRNSYTYRNGCISEYLCRNLFNQLDASLDIKSTSAGINTGGISNSTAATTPVSTGAANGSNPKVRAITGSSESNQLDSRINDFHEGIKGLCPLMKADPAPVIDNRNWHINHDTYQANRLGAISEDFYGKLGKFWIANTHACAVQYKRQLNIAFFDGSADKVAVHDTSMWHIIPKSMINHIFESDLDARIMKSTQCSLESLYGSDVRKWPGFAKSSSFPSPVRFMGAPVFLFEDSLTYMHAVKKVLDDPEGMFSAKNRGVHEQQVEGQKMHLDAAIKLFECTKSEGYPFARENTVAVGNRDPLQRTYKALSINEIPMTRSR